MSLTKNQIKYIRSLELKKNRRAEGVFLAEGPKVVGDLLGRFPCRLLAGTREWLRHLPPCLADGKSAGGVMSSLGQAVHSDVLPCDRDRMEEMPPRHGIDQVVEVSEDELRRASLLKTPQQVLALFEQPAEPTDWTAPSRELCLALDGVQDPGNMGTIVRVADWFGIRHLYCSLGTVDAFSPKVVQATMGSLARVSVHHISLPEFIRSLAPTTPVYGTFLRGENIYEARLADHGLLIVGNEGNGISAEVASLVSYRIHIPAYPAGRTDVPDSLNVAIATAIACAVWRRWGALP